MDGQVAKTDARQIVSSKKICGSLQLFTVGIMLLGPAIGVEPAFALTREQARENCRTSVGRPIVQACMRSQRGHGDLEACRAQARPHVKACVHKAMNAAHGRANVPIAIAVEKSAPAPEPSDIPAGFIAPPRTISDITAILDSEKPDPSQIEKLKAAADAKAPTSSSKHDLAEFYYTRGNARAHLGRVNEAIEDANKAMEVGRGAIDANMMGRLQQFAGLQYGRAGNLKQALAIFQRQVREADVPGARGWLFNGHRHISEHLIQMGDIEQADAYLRRSLALIQEARTSGLPGWRTSYATFGQSWEADVEYHRAVIFEARGQFREAEAAYRQGELRRRASIKGLLAQKNAPPESQMQQAADWMVLGQARMKARQGRLAEAEADARRALLARLKEHGKYNAVTPIFIKGLADVLVEQGRYGEAEKLARVSLDINREIGIADDSHATARLLSVLGGILNLQGKFKPAAAVFAELDQAIAKWEPQQRQKFDLNGARISSLYASGQIAAGLAAAQALLKRELFQVGEKHFDTAAARGTLAVGYMRAGRDADAIREFKAAIPVLMAAARENADDDDTTVIASRSARLQNIIESYIGLLAKNQKDAGGDIPGETFRLAETIRSYSVQQALAASSARMTAKDPALADLMRKEQDLTKQVNALLGTLNNVLALPSSERDEKSVRAINAAIEKARTDRDKARSEIGRRFPNYAELIDPKPPTIESIKDTLRQDEVLLSFYFGRSRSFRWAVAKDGPVAFASIAATAGDLETKVRKLREGLQPEAARLSDIPSYDLALAHELYSLLLEPVEASWKPAKNLIVVTNGALGLLPLSLLPTAPAQLKEGEGPLFAAYRNVSWLARTHAVTVVPSAAALRTLRQLPPGSDKREPMIGFGDPLFSAEQALEAQRSDQSLVEVAAVDTSDIAIRRRASPETRGVDSADLAQLPRLPDTADELKSIAMTLQADPKIALYLGKDANEQNVKTLQLWRYRIVVFATHGLVPGDLDGLTQPALALTAPAVAGVPGDGLLSMEKILGLKLDADWVILSACNTGAGAGAGAEAASGLARAFFYAGTRAVLVTNWSVHSDSARELVSELFRRQSKDPKLSRGEALRQAMLALIDSEGFKDEAGRIVFSYAHPLFWAPYSIIGDGS